MTEPSPVAADASAQALVQNADRLGLKWDLRPAIVSSVNPLAVTVDSDDVPIGATSMVGPVSVGERVFVLLVPPAGVFITGRVVGGGARNVAWGQRSASKAGIAGTETAILLLNVSVSGRSIYHIYTDTLAAGSTVNEAVAFDIRLRYTVDGTTATTSSATGAAWRILTFGASGSGSGALSFHVYLPDATGISVLLTGQRISGTGTFTVADSSAAGPSLFIDEMGALTSNKGVDQ